MNTDQAKALKYGDCVACPADRGDPAFIGTVRTEGLGNAAVYENSLGIEYICVEVLRPGHHKSVWPSCRLGKA